MLDRFNVWVGSLIARSQDLKKEDGQTAVEYALMLAVVVVGLVAVTLWSGLSGAITQAIGKVTTAIGG